MFPKEIALEYRLRRRDQALDGTLEVSLGLDIIQGNTNVSESSRQFDLPPSKIKSWIDRAKGGTANTPKAKPENIREQYESQLKAPRAAHGEAILEPVPEKIGRRAGREGRDMILQIHRCLREGNFTVPRTKLCQ